VSRVAVLLGGVSSEREVSLRSGAAISAALRRLSHDVVEIDAGRDVAARLEEARPDLVFIALHGRFGEDGCIQGLLEILGLPYTGSGVLASALAMDKVAAKTMFRAAGLPVPAGIDGKAADLAGRDPRALGLCLPLVVKPRHEGSSVGVTIVREGSAWGPALERARAYGPDVVVEECIAGSEVNVGVLEGKPLGTIEIVPATEFYDYEAKYERSDTQYIFPARLDPKAQAVVMDIGARGHAALGCRGVTRADLMVTAEGRPFLLEVNTLPGMTATSLIPKIARGIGMSFDDVCQALVQGARLGA
jgi:D-alanine-D-alanine ligase